MKKTAWDALKNPRHFPGGNVVALRTVCGSNVASGKCRENDMVRGAGRAYFGGVFEEYTREKGRDLVGGAMRVRVKDDTDFTKTD